MDEFARIAPYLSNPLVLAGFALFLFFGIHRTLIKSGIIPPLSAASGNKLTQMILKYGFIIALVVIIAGFLAQAWKSYLKAQTSKYEVDTFLTNINSISKGVDALQRQGGLIAKPSTPADFYHNAQVFRLNGDLKNAKEAFKSYFQSNQEYVDPHYVFQELLKHSDGLAEAQRFYAGLRIQFKGEVMYDFLAAKLADREERIGVYKDILKRHSEYLPVLYELSREYSRTALGQLTLEEKSLQFEYLEKFHALNKTGAFLKYFIDKDVGLKAVEDAEQRRKLLLAFDVDAIHRPIEIDVEVYSKDKVSLTIMPRDNTTEIWYKLPNMADFKSTGRSGIKSPGSDEILPNHQVALGKLPPGKYKLLTKYRDAKGRIRGPFEEEITVPKKVMQDVEIFLQNQWDDWQGMRFQDTDEEVSMMFEWCPSPGDDEEWIFSNVRYSLNKPTLDHYLLKAGKRNDGVKSGSLELKFTPLPKGKYSLFCEIEFINGKKALLKYDFAVTHDDQYHEVEAAAKVEPK